MTFKSSPIGSEITCIMYGINDAVLNDTDKLEKFLLEAANHENFKILSRASHIFRPHGYTSILLIQESHIAIHTYPEYNSLVFNLYSCRSPEDGKKAFEYFKRALNPSKVTFRKNNVIIIDDEEERN